MLTTPAPSDMHALTSAMSRTHIAPAQSHIPPTQYPVQPANPTVQGSHHQEEGQGKGVYIPPGTSLDDELLMLAGAHRTPWHHRSNSESTTSAQKTVSGSLSAPHTFSSTMEYYPDPSDWDRQGVRAHMSQQLATTDAMIKEKYAHWLECSGADLADAEVPEDSEERDALGFVVSDRMWEEWQRGGPKVLFSPKGWPEHPCWLPHHPVNEGLRGTWEMWYGREEGAGEEMDVD